jgi:hypothetical protein
MSLRSALRAFDRRYPGQSVYRATYRIPELAIVALRLDEAFRSRFGPEQGYAVTKHELNGSYSLTYFRGWTSGFGFSLVNTTDDSGKAITLAGVGRTSKLSFWSIFFAAFVGLIAFIACLIACPLLGIVLPDLVVGFISFVVAMTVLIVTYKLFYPFITFFEAKLGYRLPDETMAEVVSLFRDVVERNGPLISD